MAEGLGPEACDQCPRVEMEASLKRCSAGLGSVGPPLFNILHNDVGSGTECPLSKLSDGAKCGGVVEAAAGCGTIERDVERLEMGAERNVLELKRGKGQVLGLGRNSGGQPDVVGAKRLERSFAEHDFVVLAVQKLTMRQQCSLGSKETKSLQGGIGQRVASRSGEVLLRSVQRW